MNETLRFRILAGVVLGGAVVLAVLGQFQGGPKSPLEWLQYPLLLALAWGLFTAPAAGHQRAPLLPVVVLSWGLGMAVELTLTVDGTGIGGIHRDTFASFVLAQGDYIPLALVVWGLHRWLVCQLHPLLWIVTGVGLTEGLIFTGSVSGAFAAGAPVGAVLVTCYLIAIYWVFLVLPFRLAGLGRSGGGRNPLLLLAIGFATAFAVRMFWGLIYSPLVTAVFNLPAQ